MKKKIVILGGGLASLSAADQLLDQFDVTILEKAPFLGGLAGSFLSPEGEYIPFYYHHILTHNTFTLDYLKRYNLVDSCTWKNIKVAIGVNGKLQNITTVPGLLKFDFLNLYEKFRFGLFGLYTLFLMNPDKIQDEEDAKQWLYKYAGKAVTDKIFYNLYARNKFNVGLDIISAKQFAHRLKEREVYDKFTFPKKGLQGMIDGLEKDVKAKGGIIITKAKLTKVDFQKNEVSYNDQVLSFDLIINTVPLPELLNISVGIPEDYQKQVSKVRYCPAVGIVFATEDYLDKENYWANLFQEDVHVVMQHSLLCDRYKNKVTWCLRYGGSEEDFPLTDEQVKEKYFRSLKKYFGDFKPVWSIVFKEKYAEPIYDKDFSNYKPGYRTPLKNFYMSGIQVTHPKIRNMNSALLSGIEVARIIKEDENPSVQIRQ